MSDTYSPTQMLKAIAYAAQVIDERKDEINKLNVFPVPDGDTGTNMSLTIKSVVNNINSLPKTATPAETSKAIVTGALMGARGNSGVITSQILRGLTEGSVGSSTLSTEVIASAFEKAVEVAFQAVRKPVEGTILTVLRDSAEAAKAAAEKGLDTDEALESIVSEAYASVQRTPEFLPVLKENGVVDAGGFGLAMLFDAFTASLLGKEDRAISFDAMPSATPKVEIEQINDWEDANYRYCNEFLVDSDILDIDETLDFLATMGDCELCVGAAPKFKVHVHSDTPNKVLEYFLDRGQISEVFIHNMELQSADRLAKIAAEDKEAERKPLGFVAVAAGEGSARILESLGVDVVVSGGQTMNPSTKDLLDAAERVNADAVIILPDNSNIIMAAHSACELSDKPCGVVPTKSVPQAFAAMFAVDPEASIEDNVSTMTEAASGVLTGEVTTAIKDSKDSSGGPICEGDVIGIADGSIDAVGSDVESVVLELLKKMEAQDFDTLTLLAGKDLSDDSLDAIVDSVENEFEDLEIDAQHGGQPLYPVVFSLE